jgi:epoxyqueuosine reductase
MNDNLNNKNLAENIKQWGLDLGFDAVGISNINFDHQKDLYKDWLAQGYQGEMQFLERHKNIKFDPKKLLDGTQSIISVRLDYLPLEKNTLDAIKQKDQAYIARYSLGRDYHKVIRNKLKQFVKKLESELQPLEIKARVFTDSAPVLEVEAAKKSGLGWRGKHTLLLNKDHGSWFFLGEIYINQKLHEDKPDSDHCGTCSACIDICPTGAILGPYKLDARRCISYLTIEHKTSIPVEYRKKIGNRIYGCDDCQIICPWNKYAKMAREKDFHVRNNLDQISLIDCFEFNEDQFKSLFQGSAIYRIGHEQWLRNVAVALGNAPKSERVRNVLKSRLESASELLKEHILWAIEQHN